MGSYASRVDRPPDDSVRTPFQPFSSAVLPMLPTPPIPAPPATAPGPPPLPAAKDAPDVGGKDSSRCVTMISSSLWFPEGGQKGSVPYTIW